MNKLASTVSENFEGPGLPEEITARFDVMELLGQNEMGETFLLSEKGGGKLFVLKSFKHADHSETEILKGLEHKGLPKFEPEIPGETVYTLREYVKGISLEEHLADYPVLHEDEAVYILTELCGVIGFLHTRDVPIIHRDIKPSNVIYNPRTNP